MKILSVYLKSFLLPSFKGTYGYLPSEKGKYLNPLCVLDIKYKLRLLLPRYSEHHSDLTVRMEAYPRQVTNRVMT